MKFLFIFLVLNTLAFAQTVPTHGGDSLGPKECEEATKIFNLELRDVCKSCKTTADYTSFINKTHLELSIAKLHESQFGKPLKATCDCHKNWKNMAEWIKQERQYKIRCLEETYTRETLQKVIEIYEDKEKK